MTRVSGETFRDCLAGLDAEDLTAFVAAVYAARGWAVDRDGDDLVATPPDTERPRRFTVRAGADVTITRRDGGDVTTLDAADLRELVWYAIDGATRTRLFREFFDREPDTVAVSAPPTPTTSTDDGDGDGDGDGADDEERGPADDGRRRDRTVPDADVPADDGGEGADGADGTDGTDGTAVPARRVLVAGLIVALLVAGVAAAGPALTSSAGAGGAGGADGADGADGPGVAVPNGSATRLEGTPNVMDREGRPVAPGMIKVASVPEPRPPGVRVVGVVNVSALTDAHAAALSNRSYRLTVHHREFVDGAPRGFVRERTVVADATHYRSDLRWVGTVRQDPQAIGNTSAYADGRARYVRLAGEAGATVETDLRPDDRYASRSERYLRRTLTGSDTRVVGAFEHDGTLRFWITVSRDEEGEMTGSILVDERGLVHELHHEYVYRPADGPPVRVVVTMRATPTNVSVSAPTWVNGTR
jgi:hypothetical protein